MLSFRNLLTMALALDEVDAKQPDDEFVSFLPLRLDRRADDVRSPRRSRSASPSTSPRSPTRCTENIREIGPHVMFAPPRIWENDDLHRPGEDHGHHARSSASCTSGCMPVGERLADLRFEKKPIAAWAGGSLYWLGARRSSSGRSRTGSGCHDLRTRLHRRRRARPRRLPLLPRHGRAAQADLRPDRDLRHLLHPPRRRHRTSTRWASPSPAPTSGSPRAARSSRGARRSSSATTRTTTATAATLKDGWLHSGDAGYLTEDGQLVVIDRVKDVMQLARRDAVLAAVHREPAQVLPLREGGGGDRDRTGPTSRAMLCIDMGVVGKWAERNKLSYTTYTDLSAKPEVYDLVRARGRRGERDAPRRRPHREVRAPLQGARRRRRGADPHAQGAPRLRGASATRSSSQALYGDAQEVRHRHHDQVPGRQDRADPDHARSSAASSTGRRRSRTWNSSSSSRSTASSSGAIYALVALGFVIIYKSSSILNFAQGEFLMLGAYVCLALVDAATGCRSGRPSSSPSRSSRCWACSWSGCSCAP